MEVSRMEACASVVPLKIQSGCNDLGSGAMQSSNRWSSSTRRRIVNNNENEQTTAVMADGARARVLANARAGLRKPEIEAQFVSFNFTNPLICGGVSSVATAGHN